MAFKTATMGGVIISSELLHGLRPHTGSSPMGSMFPLVRRRCLRVRKQDLLMSRLKHSAVSRSWVSVRARELNMNMEEVLRIGQQHDDQEGKGPLDDYMDKVQMCNRGSERKSEFFPFIVENSVLGYIHPTIVQHLKQFRDVFTISLHNGCDSHYGLFDKEACMNDFITFHHQLKTPDERTEAVGDAVKWLHKEGVIPGLRNEKYPVVLEFGMQAFFSLERAAVPFFGTKAYGVHMNGYVDIDGEKSLWIGKRSKIKATYPGLLDNLVAGGLPDGISCKENLIKESDEEAGIQRAIAEMAIPVGVVAYEDIDENRFKRDVLFCYDLHLPNGFQPKNKDGELEDFMLIPIDQVATIIRKTKLFKPNCALVIIDFLFRHGYIKPEEVGYLHLLQSLRRGECL